MTEPLKNEPVDCVPDCRVVPRFRRIVVLLSLGLMAALALAALLFGKPAAHGVMLGGTAALLGFEISVRTFRLETGGGDKVKFRLRIWWVVRFLAYAAALWKGHSLDTVQYSGLFGAIVGLLIVRVVVMVVGITGVDLKKASG
ncbi:MAG TPA: hypothetical protein PKO36_14315 [Candidatus Hydrogenedentes bacterium]|nr:hypothetical protein [Candidatus Hydrogenedentota bacterium]HOV75035.1 hypothetical protein [Candidatus Hydrogenedentota bacterium]